MILNLESKTKAKLFKMKYFDDSPKTIGICS